MRSLPAGAFVAAIVMFALGFVFFGLLGMMLHAPLDPATATALRSRYERDARARCTALSRRESSVVMTVRSATI